jgi:hypothetical protein
LTGRDRLGPCLTARCGTTVARHQRGVPCAGLVVVECESLQPAGDRDPVLSLEVFDRLVADLEKPAVAVPELVCLFERHPKMREV